MRTPGAGIERFKIMDDLFIEAVALRGGGLIAAVGPKGDIQGEMKEHR
jgi:hypothetical protein